MYNEGPNIEKQLKNIRDAMKKSEYKYKVLIINDGRPDVSPSIVEKYSKKMPIKKIDHKINMGLGKAVADLLIEAVKMSEKGDIIITMDADNTFLPVQIQTMIPYLSQEYDLIIASRFVKGSVLTGVPFYRKICGWGVRGILKVAFNIHGVSDYTVGYRAYKAEIVREYVETYGNKVIEQKGFSCMVEILIKMNKMKRIRIKEIPLNVRYDQKQNTSKLKLYKTIKEYIALIVHEKLR